MLLPPAAADRAAGVRFKLKDKGPSINNRSEQSIYPTQKSVLTSEATPQDAADRLGHGDVKLTRDTYRRQPRRAAALKILDNKA
jgi:hypothetical protein